MLVAATPIDVGGKNLGGAYNDFLDKFGDGDWVCLIDHDAMWTTTTWAEQIEIAITVYQNLGYKLFVPVTNRVGCALRWMKAQGSKKRGHDMIVHRALGRKLADENEGVVKDVTDWTKNGLKYPLAGVMMCINVGAWRRVGGFKKGFLGVDNDMHRRMRDNGFKVGLLEGVYVYHWYRAGGRGS